MLVSVNSGSNVPKNDGQWSRKRKWEVNQIEKDQANAEAEMEAAQEALMDAKNKLKAKEEACSFIKNIQMKS